VSADAEHALARDFLLADPTAAAHVLERSADADVVALLAALPASQCAALVDQMAHVVAARYVAAMPPARAAEIVEALPVERASQILRVVPAKEREAILGRAPAQAFASALEKLLAYPDGTAGALADPTVHPLASDASAEEALAIVLRAPGPVVSYLYVVDRTQRLVGVVGLRELLLVAKDKTLGEVMDREVECLRSTAAMAEIVAHPGWDQWHALPVIDESGVFVGALRYRALRRLERSAGDGNERNTSVETLLSLSELYWIGLSSLVGGVNNGSDRGGGSARVVEERRGH
jgi:magnesium transporter